MLDAKKREYALRRKDFATNGPSDGQVISSMRVEKEKRVVARAGTILVLMQSGHAVRVERKEKKKFVSRILQIDVKCELR